MRVLTCLVAVGLAAGTTGCIDMMGPGMGYSPYTNSAFGMAPSPMAMNPIAAAASAMNPYAMGSYAPAPYYGGYQQPQVINQYVPVPTASPPVQQPNYNRWARRHRDSDGDGIPNWVERRQRDSDNDGIPDWRERRQERREQRRAGRLG